MRKYFLLSAVALLAASTANATTDYAEVTAKATIEVANTFTCSELNFGTIVMKQNNEKTELWLTHDGSSLDSYDIDSTNIISATDYDTANCSFDSVVAGNITLPTSIQLTGVNTSEKLTVDSFGYAGVGGEPDVSFNKLHIGAMLHIPSKVTADEYIGSFTVSVVY
ncbi:MAG: DUF4402 domain-containing protein [Alphaproteobacteria bacterium]|nr:DUF4402 domain-containing protein [Alphaproteobacteria bacterium]